MTRTANYKLSQWEATDPIRRSDFNEDNAKIDAALSSAYSADNVPWETGSLDLSSAEAGDVVKTFDFEPKAIFIFVASVWTGAALNGSSARINGTSATSYRQFKLSGNALTLTYSNGGVPNPLEYLALK